MAAPPTPDQIHRLHRATGLGMREARELLSWQPELGERILRAAQTQKDRLHDPLENDPQHGPVIAAALERARAESAELKPDDDALKRGLIHWIWKRAKQILREEHGLVWYSPAEMNPGSVFD